MKENSVKIKRRKNSVDVRVSDCEICGFPLIHVHHTLPFAEWSETNYKLHLCPNCHELLHICIKAIVYKKTRATEVWNKFCDKVGKTSPLVRTIEDKTYEWTEMNLEFAIKYYDDE